MVYVNDTDTDHGSTGDMWSEPMEKDTYDPEQYHIKDLYLTPYEVGVLRAQVGASNSDIVRDVIKGILNKLPRTPALELPDENHRNSELNRRVRVATGIYPEAYDLVPTTDQLLDWCYKRRIMVSAHDSPLKDFHGQRAMVNMFVPDLGRVRADGDTVWHALRRAVTHYVESGKE